MRFLITKNNIKREKMNHLELTYISTIDSSFFTNILVEFINKIWYT